MGLGGVVLTLSVFVTLRIQERARASAEDWARKNALEHFTPREMSLLRHLAEGCTYHEIADRLSIAEKIVRNTVSQMIGKSNVKSRNELIAVYVRSDRDRE